MSMSTLIGPRVGNANYVFKTEHVGEKMYCIEFSVFGRGHFPYDMLRYDMCHPVDSSGMHYDSGEQTSTSDRSARTVKLRTWSRNKHWQPTYGRWSSFGWSVTTDIWESQKGGA